MTATAPAPPATDAMLPRGFRVTSWRRDTADTATLWLEPTDGVPMAFGSGQFTMLQAFGVGEVPISISGDPAHPETLVHTIRDVGGVTTALVAARPGDVLAARGPYGVGWQVTDGRGGDVVVVAGGIGLAPLRGAVLELAAHLDDYARVFVLYGARTPDDMLYPDELVRWADAGIEVTVTVDQAGTDWDGRVGLVTELVNRADFDPSRTLALVCGPEVMMRFVGTALVRRGVPAARVRLSMERNMRCGIGLCGHCQLREHLICVDGPVFPLDAVAELMTVREL